MNNRQKKQREKILKGAQEMFMSKGFTNTSTSQLAEHIRVSKTTLYNHFPSKEDLLEATLVFLLNEIEEQLTGILEDDRVPTFEKIQKFMVVIVTHLRDMKIEVINDIKHNAPSIYSLVIVRQTQLINMYLLDLFNTAVEQGIFRKDLDQQIVIDIITHSLKILGSPEYLQHSPHTFESMFQHVFKLVMEGNLSSDIKDNVGYL